MSEQPEAFQLAAELERTDSPLRRPDTVALRAAELLRQQWQDIQHVCAAERDRAIEHTHAVGEKVLLIREQHAEIERLRADAERYRYLRNRDPDEVFNKSGKAAGVWIDWEDDTAGLQLLTGDDADAAIDAAMAEERKP